MNVRLKTLSNTSLLRKWLLRVLAVVVVFPAALIMLYRLVNPPVTPLMVIRAVQGDGLTRHWVNIEQISPNLVDAVIAGEDNLFCRHFGFDTRALATQVEAWSEGDRPRGASTITMQTAKNVLLWPGRDPLRKVLEAFYTPQIELVWSKRRILEVYLNVAEMGVGVFGAEAAAQHYFNKPASNLSPREAALIAALLPNPRRWSASHPTFYLQRRASRLMRRVDQLGPLLDCTRKS